MAAPLTRELGAFAASLKIEHLPRKAVEAVQTGFVDTIGVMFSGIDFPVSKHALALAGSLGVNGEARLYLGKERGSSVDIALANAAASTAGVFDDVAFAGCHTSVILVPALLAEGEVLGKSGKDVITAYAAGYEVWARLMERDAHAYSSKGWHATAVFGPIAGAAALANLRGLDAEATTRALAIAAAMGAGITRSFDFDIGPFQVARAASAGVMAARLAAAGMTAAPDAIEREGRGMLQGFSPQGHVDLDTPIADLGTAWRLESVGIHVKRHPVGNMMQRAIDGLLDLVLPYDVKPGDVKRIEALISLAQMEVHNKSPSTAGGRLVPSHSIELALAAALIDRELRYEHLQEAFYDRKDVREVMGRIEIVADGNVPNDTTPNLGFSGGIRLHLADGRVLESPSVPFARGHWTRRLGPEEAWKKFVFCTKGRLAEPAARALFGQLMALDTVSKVAELRG